MVCFGIKEENVLRFQPDGAVSNPLKDISEYVESINDTTRRGITIVPMGGPVILLEHLGTKLQGLDFKVIYVNTETRITKQDILEILEYAYSLEVGKRNVMEFKLHELPPITEVSTDYELNGQKKYRQGGNNRKRTKYRR